MNAPTGFISIGDAARMAVTEALLRKVGTVERIPVADRATWMALRQKDVTASVIGTLMGVHDYMTPYRLYCEKAGIVQPDPEDRPVISDDGNEMAIPPTMRGALFEQAVLDALARMRPDWSVIPANDAYYRLTEHRIGATPDAFAIDPARPGRGIVQVKTTSDIVFREKWLDGDGDVSPPLWILCQAMTEARITGSAWACIALLDVGINTRLRIIDVPLVDSLWDAICKEVAEFWSRVETGRPYAPDYARDGSVIEALHRHKPNTTIDLSSNNRIAFLCEERLAWSRRRTTAEAALETISNEILDLMKGAEVAEHPEFRISNKSQKRREAVLPASEFTVLRVTRAKKSQSEGEAA